MNLNFSYEDTKPKRSKFKIILIISIVVLIIGMIGASIYFYIFNEQFKGLVDKYIFAKEVSSEDLKYVLVSDNNTQYIGVYKNYVITLEKGKLEAYNSTGKKVFEFNVSINNPITDTNKNFLVVAENKGQKLYYISSNSIAWEKDLEGHILSIHTNKNGYLSVILSDSAYKSIIITFDNKGKELFRTGLGNTYAVDADISSDNKYMAFAELNTNGAIIKSNIKIISIEKAVKNEEDTYIYTYNDTSESLVTGIKFQNKNRLICMYDTKIDEVIDGKCELITEISSKESSFVDINLDNTILKTRKIATGLFSEETEIVLINTNNKKERVYKFNGTPKKIYTYGKLIAIDLGSEIHYINTSGWLKKRYTNNEENKNIVLSDKISGIIYKDKIELLNL